MPALNLDYNELAEHARKIMADLTDKNDRVGGLFYSGDGTELMLKAIKKTAELAAKKVKNTKKSHEFAIWFSNEYENCTGQSAPDKVVNGCKEVCVNLLTPYKRLFFT